MLTDDDLGRELTAAFRQLADPIARTAIAPAPLFRQALRRRRRSAAVRSGSLIAAMTAVATAVTVLLTTAGRPSPEPLTMRGPAGPLLAAAVTTAPPASAAEQGMPRFYLVADHSQPVANVRDSVTGQPVSTVRLPPGTDPKLTQAAAAADGRTFALALFSRAHGTRFYELRITASGQRARLSRLAIPPLPAGQAADAVALTPDGTRLAVAVQIPGQHGKLEVITLATGAVRTWITRRGGLPEALSWDAAGQRLAYFWASGTASSAGLWLLDTSAPGTGLLSGRRLLPQRVGPDDVQSALISPDARSIIAAVTYDGKTKVSRGTIIGGIAEVSARTGQPLRTLLAERAAYSSDAGWHVTSCLLPAIDTTGAHLLVSCGQFGRLDRGRFTSLPGSPPHTAVAAAW
jgi:hypothetical protein